MLTKEKKRKKEKSSSSWTYILKRQTMTTVMGHIICQMVKTFMGK